MNNKTARALAIVALVFAAIFIASLIATLVDYTLLNNGVGFIALGSGVFVVMIFIALKADGRTYSITKMNNEIEMQKLEKEAAEREAAQSEQSAKAEDEKDSDGNDTSGDSALNAQSAIDETAEQQQKENGVKTGENETAAPARRTKK